MDEDFEIDPAMAEAMGFSSFGTKRRKHNHDQSVVAPVAVDPSTASTGANNIELGTRNSTTAPVNSMESYGEMAQEQELGTTEGRIQGQETMQEMAQAGREQATQQAYTWTSGWPDREELSALRKGIRNQRGDMIVFMPSFVEDPWKGLG